MHALHHPHRVGLVVDREGALVAEPRGASARRIRAQAEWKVITHIAREIPPTRPPTRSRISFAALLVNVIARISIGRAPPGRQQPGDPVGEDAGLARARAGEHQQRPLAVGDRLALGGVQVGEQALDLVGPGLDRRPVFGLHRHRPEDSRARGAPSAVSAGRTGAREREPR